MKKQLKLQFLISLLILGNLLSYEVFAAVLPPLAGTQAVDGVWQPIETTTTFSGGFSVDNSVFNASGHITAGRTVNIAGEINVDSRHVGQFADLIVYADFITLDNFSSSTFTLGGGGTEIKEWNRELSTLLAFVPQTRLSAIQPLQIWNDLLPVGRLKIYFGYLLSGTLVNNSQSIEIIVESLPSPIANNGDRGKDPTVDPSPILVSDDPRLTREGLLWPESSVLKVGFDFNGAELNQYLPAICYPEMPHRACEEAIATEVIKIASNWSQYGNIYFRRMNWKDSDIRIRFQERGSYSYIGMEFQETLLENQETMNLPLSFLQTSEDFRATVLHEFGHALGLKHGAFDNNIYAWNESQIIEDFLKLGWNEEEIRQKIINNFLKKVPEWWEFAEFFDPHSIMVYPILKGWVSSDDLADSTRCPSATTNPNYCIAPTSYLSEQDKQQIALFYPKKGDCSMDYEPSRYQFDATTQRSSLIAFNNPTQSTVRVILYHPDAPGWSFGTWDVLPGQNTLLYQGEQPLTITGNWGIRVNDSPICIVETVSLLDPSYFQLSTTKMPLVTEDANAGEIL